MLGVMAPAMDLALVAVCLAVMAAGRAMGVHARAERLPAAEQRRNDRQKTETFHR
jgi:hypothetical protein